MHYIGIAERRALTWANPARLARYRALIKFTGGVRIHAPSSRAYRDGHRASLSLSPSLTLSHTPPFPVSSFLKVRLTCRRNVGRARLLPSYSRGPPISFLLRASLLCTFLSSRFRLACSSLCTLLLSLLSSHFAFICLSLGLSFSSLLALFVSHRSSQTSLWPCVSFSLFLRISRIVVAISHFLLRSSLLTIYLVDS